MKTTDHVKMLEVLIEQYYRKLRDDDQKEITLGDLLKMMEMKRKLAPSSADNSDFWKMLEEIRRGTLPAERKRKSDNVPKKTRTGRKTE